MVSPTLFGYSWWSFILDVGLQSAQIVFGVMFSMSSVNLSNPEEGPEEVQTLQ